MLTRRLLRVKAFKVLFSNMAQESPSIDNMKKELRFSCEKTQELYWFLLSICKSLVNVARERIEAGKRKYKATPEEANPNYRFVNNSFVELLSQNEEMTSFVRNEVSCGSIMTMLSKEFSGPYPQAIITRSIWLRQRALLSATATSSLISFPTNLKITRTWPES